MALKSVRQAKTTILPQVFENTHAHVILTFLSDGTLRYYQDGGRDSTYLLPASNGRGLHRDSPGVPSLREESYPTPPLHEQVMLIPSHLLVRVGGNGSTWFVAGNLR